MELARKYAQIVKSRLLHHAAWSPVTDTYEVGDYGAFREGIFQKLGNIREFGIDPAPKQSTSTVGFDFASSGTTMVRTAAGASVDVFPSQPVEAKLQLDFQGDSSVFLRTSKLTVIEMPSVNAVAGQLHRKRDANGRRWKLGWRIIRKVYVATDPVILMSLERGATFSISGTATALKAVEAGSGSASLSVSSNKANTLQIVGGTGPVAFDLFRVRVGGGAGLSFDVSRGPSQEDEPAEPELDDEWDDEPEDDDDDLFEGSDSSGE